MRIACKTVSADDVCQLLTFMRDYYQTEGIPFDLVKSRTAIPLLLRNATYGQVRLIQSDDLPIGYFCLSYGFSLENFGRDCFLDEIYLEPLHRNQGIGHRVLTIIEGQLASRGFKALHLIVHDNNRRAFDYYVRNGFLEQKAKFMTKELAATLTGEE